MKLLKVITLLFISISLVNCGDDDKPKESFDLSAENFTGTYSLVSVAESTERTVTDGGNTTTLSSTSSEINEDITITSQVVFNSDGTYVFSGIYTETSSTTGSDGETDEVSNSIVTDDEGDYELNVANNTVTLTSDDGEVETYDITTFTADRLVLYQNETEPEGQIEETFESTIEYERN